MFTYVYIICIIYICIGGVIIEKKKVDIRLLLDLLNSGIEKTEIARILKITRKTLLNKIDKYNIRKKYYIEEN